MRRSCSFKITKHPPWQLWHNPADFSCYFAVLSASLNVNPITKTFVFSNKGTVFRGSVSSGFNHLSWGELTNNHLGIPFTTDLGRRMKEGVVWRKRRRGSLPPPFLSLFFLTSAEACHRAPVNPRMTYPWPRMEMIFKRLFFWTETWLILEVSKVFWKKEEKKPSSGSSLAHVAENYLFYYYENLCQFSSLLGLFSNRFFLIKLTTGAALLTSEKQKFWNQ